MRRPSRLPFFLSFSLALIALSVLAACQKEELPKARHGELDARPVGAKTLLPLQGEWRFSYYDADGTEGKSLYARVPGYWTADGFPSAGRAKYSLTLRLDPALAPYALWLPDINSAYILYENGKRIAQAGEYGDLNTEHRASYNIQTVFLESEGPTVELTLAVSNREHDKGGLWKAPILGQRALVMAYASALSAIEFFLLGGILIIGLYHLGLVLMNLRDRSSLYLAGLCFDIGLRLALTGGRILYGALPIAFWTAAYRAEVATVYVGTSLFMLFLRSLYPDSRGHRVFIFFTALGVLWTSAAAFIPSVWISALNDSYHPFLVAACVYVLWVLSQAAKRGHSEATLLIFGFSLLFVSIIAEIVAALFLLRVGLSAPMGFISFLVSAFAIHIHLARAQEQAKAYQEKLFQADKLAVLGTLVAGTAHEINNPNNSILLTAEGLAASQASVWEDAGAEAAIELNKDSSWEMDLKEGLSRIIRNSDRIKTIVQDLKDFACQEAAAALTKVDLKAALDASVLLLESERKRVGAVLEFNTIASELWVLASRTKVEQIFVNILQNAYQALTGEVRKLTITVSSINDRVCCSIADTGKGMSEKEKEHIFDPFFTTKGARGSGLGLAIVQRILNELGGSIEIKSELGQGTEVLVYLQAVDAETGEVHD